MDSLTLENTPSSLMTQIQYSGITSVLKSLYSLFSLPFNLSDNFFREFAFIPYQQIQEKFLLLIKQEINIDTPKQLLQWLILKKKLPLKYILIKFQQFRCNSSLEAFLSNKSREDSKKNCLVFQFEGVTTRSLQQVLIIYKRITSMLYSDGVWGLKSLVIGKFNYFVTVQVDEDRWVMERLGVCYEYQNWQSFLLACIQAEFRPILLFYQRNLTVSLEYDYTERVSEKVDCMLENIGVGGLKFSQRVFQSAQDVLKRYYIRNKGFIRSGVVQVQTSGEGRSQIGMNESSLYVEVREKSLNETGHAIGRSRQEAKGNKEVQILKKQNQRVLDIVDHDNGLSQRYENLMKIQQKTQISKNISQPLPDLRKYSQQQTPSEKSIQTQNTPSVTCKVKKPRNFEYQDQQQDSEYELIQNYQIQNQILLQHKLQKIQKQQHQNKIQDQLIKQGCLTPDYSQSPKTYINSSPIPFQKIPMLSKSKPPILSQYITPIIPRPPSLTKSPPSLIPSKGQYNPIQEVGKQTPKSDKAKSPPPPLLHKSCSVREQNNQTDSLFISTSNDLSAPLLNPKNQILPPIQQKPPPSLTENETLLNSTNLLPFQKIEQKAPPLLALNQNFSGFPPNLYLQEQKKNEHPIFIQPKKKIQLVMNSEFLIKKFEPSFKNKSNSSKSQESDDQEISFNPNIRFPKNFKDDKFGQEFQYRSIKIKKKQISQTQQASKQPSILNISSGSKSKLPVFKQIDQREQQKVPPNLNSEFLVKKWQIRSQNLSQKQFVKPPPILTLKETSYTKSVQENILTKNPPPKLNLSQQRQIFQRQQNDFSGWTCSNCGTKENTGDNCKNCHIKSSLQFEQNDIGTRTTNQIIRRKLPQFKLKEQ